MTNMDFLKMIYYFLHRKLRDPIKDILSDKNTIVEESGTYSHTKVPCGMS